MVVGSSQGQQKPRDGFKEISKGIAEMDWRGSEIL